MSAGETKWVRVADVAIREPFSSLFPIQPKILAAITAAMGPGYDEAEPVVIWAEENVLVDGHTRLQAAKNAGLTLILANYHSFPDEEAALVYAIARQRKRRNITNADIMRWVALVDQRRQAGRPEKLAPSGANSGKSAKETAKIVGVSQRTVERVRTVMDSDDDDVKQAVLSGDLSFTTAADEVIEKKQKAMHPNVTAKTQAHVPGSRYRGVIVNGFDKSMDELLAVPVDDLVHPDGGCVYLGVSDANLRAAFDVLDKWGFACQKVVPMCREDSHYGTYASGEACFVLLGMRGKILDRPLPKLGYWKVDRRVSGLPEVLYRLAFQITPSPYLEAFPTSYRDAVTVWGEGMTVGIWNPAPELPKQSFDRIRMMTADGAWRTIAEVADLTDMAPTTVMKEWAKLPRDKMQKGRIVKFRTTVTA